LSLVNAFERTSSPASELMVGLQCGGSDAWSGITANPALGYACDLLVAQGGTGVLAETPEIYGAEHLLTARAISQEVGEKMISLIKWWEDYTARNLGSMDNNPSPGNKKGGLTTILEKSLGAVAKGGTTPLTGVYKYAEPIKARGFAFTTGRGSAFGAKPSPSMKISTNTEMFKRLSDDMDLNAGSILTDGVSVEQVGQDIFNMWLRIASGEKTKSELQGLGDYEFVPWQIGAVM
jgi:altronate hydrolase